MSEPPAPAAASYLKSDQSFRVLFERSADAISLFDPQLGRFIESNDAVVRLTRAPSKEALGLASPLDISPERQPDGRLSADVAPEMIQQALTQGSHRFEWLARRFDGTELPLDIVLTSIPFGDRSLLLTVSRDLSERRQTETALRESQQLLSSIADNLAEAVFRTDPSHEIVYVNRAYLHKFGYASLDAVQREPRRHFYARPIDRDRFLQGLEQQGQFSDEIEFRRADGSAFWGLIRSRAIRDPDTAALLYHVGSITDVTGRRRMEAELTASEERWRLLFEQSPLSIQVFDPSGKTRRVNRAWEQLFQLSEDQLRTFSILEDQQLMDKGVMPYILKAFSGEVVRVPPVHYELRALSDQPARDARWIGALLFPILNAQRRVIEVVCIHEDLTERKRAEDAIRQLNATLEERVLERTTELAASEARLRTILEHAPEAIVVLDADTGHFVSCNANASRLYGLSPDELLRVGPADLSPPRQPDGRPSSELALAAVQRALAGETHTLEWIHRHSSGRLIPCEVRLVRLPAEGRNLVRGSVLDNSERRRRERIQHSTYEISEAVHAAEDLDNLYPRIHAIIRSLMPAENFYIALLDPTTQMITFPYHVDACSPRPPPMTVTTGLTGTVLRTGKPLLVSRTMEARKFAVGEAVVIDGVTELPYIESGTPAAIWLGVPLALQDRPIGVMAVQDYSNEAAYGEEEKQILSFVATQVALAIDRKRAAQLLRESEQKFRALFEATSTGVMIHDEHQFLEVNPAVCRQFGYATPADLLGKSPRDTSPPCQPDGSDSGDASRRHIADCMAHGHTRFEWVARRADGSDLPLEVILTRIEMGGRQLIQAVTTDISQRKQAEAELLRSLVREKELSDLKSSFVAMVSHEFRTPLGIIQSSAEILADYLDRLPPDERREHLLSITKNTRRMASLMEEVLVLGRLDAGGVGFQPSALDLHRLCTRIIDEVLSATDRITPIHLVAPTPPVKTDADENLLRHILTNLLTNAVKYSEPGNPVTCSVRVDGPHAVFEVRDRGIGIAEADLPRLFHAFYRGRNVGGRPGTGLGLVIVKRCLELHDGEIQVHSLPGQGTTMTVRIPAAHPNPAPARRESSRSARSDEHNPSLPRAS